MQSVLDTDLEVWEVKQDTGKGGHNENRYRLFFNWNSSSIVDALSEFRILFVTPYLVFVVSEAPFVMNSVLQAIGLPSCGGPYCNIYSFGQWIDIVGLQSHRGFSTLRFTTYKSLCYGVFSYGCFISICCCILLWLPITKLHC